MDKCADTHTDYDIGKDLFCRFCDLLPSIFQTVTLCQLILWGINALAVSDKLLHLIFEVQLFDKRTACYGNHKPDDYIHHSDLPPEYAHQQNKRAEVYHW